MDNILSTIGIQALTVGICVLVTRYYASVPAKPAVVKQDELPNVDEETASDNVTAQKLTEVNATIQIPSNPTQTGLAAIGMIGNDAHPVAQMIPQRPGSTKDRTSIIGDAINSTPKRQIFEETQSQAAIESTNSSFTTPAIRVNLLEDEYDVDFSDTKAFAHDRWNMTVGEVRKRLAIADYRYVMEPRELNDVQARLQSHWNDPRTAGSITRLLPALIQFPRTLGTFFGIFTRHILPNYIDFTILWGLVDLNFKLSIVSADKLSRTVVWTKRLRRLLELCNRCLDNCDDYNEARLAMIDVLDSVLQIFVDSVTHLRTCPNDEAAYKTWEALDSQVKKNIENIEAAVAHINDIMTYSSINQEKAIRDFKNRHGPQLTTEEASFPLTMIKRTRNERFYGRVEELKKIDHYLGAENNNTLRTYTIYGRRGVGKTDLALEYAYKNHAGFDAIFWINCETRLSLRLSFSEMAVTLGLPNATKDKNQLAVNKWLKHTKKRWLLIFDNAEREKILKGYWPVGGAIGSILITSRSFFNFTMDAVRRGETVKPFTPAQSRELLFQLLGPAWQDLARNGRIKSSEERAATELLESVGHLALAVEQVAKLIQNPPEGGPGTIQATYESFKKRKRDLQPRFLGERTSIVASLDTVWDMTFSNLSTNARDLLSVLSLLSPDGILEDLFLPKNQQALKGKLAFCKQPSNLVDPNSHATLSSVITAPLPLEDAINELRKAYLIRKEGRVIWCHRVVQEAMNYHSNKALQEYFDAASALVYEAFPKQVSGDYFSKQQRGEAQEYISHGCHLSFMFYTFHRPGGSIALLTGSSNFIHLLSNCAWFLYEISDYDLCLELIITGKVACGENKETLQFASLCNIAGCTYVEINKLAECRIEMEDNLRLHQLLLPQKDPLRASSLHNMGNLEACTDNLEEAMDYYQKALDIRLSLGDEAASSIALSYVCIARVHYLRREFELAYSNLSRSEALYFRTAGADAHFMTHVHYLYGNIEFEQKQWGMAKRSYELSLKISLANAPIHPITAAAYYSLGCMEYEKANLEGAKVWLDRALSIACIRSPGRDDGTITRILWKTSQVLESDVVGTYFREANEMRIRAERARAELSSRGEGGIIIALDDDAAFEDGFEDGEEQEKSYDLLVPAFFR